MVDRVSPKTRSSIMASVSSKNTGPELTIRKLLFSIGYRYKLHPRNLPGTPDIAFTKREKVIFVHGCFWHGHECKYGRLPKSRTEYWAEKIKTNRHRDKKNLRKLHDLGWQALVIWQCQLKNENLKDVLIDFLGPTRL